LHVTMNRELAVGVQVSPQPGPGPLTEPGGLFQGKLGRILAATGGRQRRGAGRRIAVPCGKVVPKSRRGVERPAEKLYRRKIPLLGYRANPGERKQLFRVSGFHRPLEDGVAIYDQHSGRYVSSVNLWSVTQVQVNALGGDDVISLGEPGSAVYVPSMVWGG